MKFKLPWFRFGRKSVPAPLPEEDDFLDRVRCAAHDWEPEVQKEIVRAKRPRLKGVLRRKHA